MKKSEEINVDDRTMFFCFLKMEDRMMKNKQILATQNLKYIS